VCIYLQVIDKSRLDDVSRAHLFQEVRCMKLVQHPNVVRLYEVIDTQTKLYLVLELGDGGDLYDYIMKHDRGLNEQEAGYYFSQVLYCTACDVQVSSVVSRAFGSCRLSAQQQHTAL